MCCVWLCVVETANSGEASKWYPKRRSAHPRTAKKVYTVQLARVVPRGVRFAAPPTTAKGRCKYGAWLVTDSVGDEMNNVRLERCAAPSGRRGRRHTAHKGSRHQRRTILVDNVHVSFEKCKTRREHLAWSFIINKCAANWNYCATNKFSAKLHQNHSQNTWILCAKVSICVNWR